MRINHNIAALNTYRQLGNANNAQQASMEKLSSGLRINGAKDDAAGLAISEKMRGQIRGLDQASSNAQDANSLIQTAEGALNETTEILQRMRELATQAANDTNTADDRSEIQKEVNQLTEEINRIGNNTEFNTKKLINGDAKGAGTSGATQESVKFDFSGIVAGTSGNTVLTIGGTDYNIQFDATVANSDTGSADTVNAGTKTIKLATMTSNPEELGDRLKKAFETMRGADPSLSISDFTFTSDGTEGLTIAATAGGEFDGQAGDGQIKHKSGLTISSTPQSEGSNGTNGTLTFQIGANNDQQMTLDINDMRSVALGIASTSGGGDADAAVGSAVFATGSSNAITKDVTTGTEYALDISSAAKATDAITVIDNAIQKVSQERSKLGAYQNRLDHTINNLSTSSENLTAAESRIRDVDMAKEMMDQTKNSILSQASQAMLAQANQLPQGVLQLLR
ncbi:flagellin [Lysinibacillus composti]|uniref:Flagellin n=1 Tax=Lysinibacillus composti TaxID=720633 RepID=A0A3N9UH57_9BACI|nr:flagellin [Lysinibacillus composti]MBM7607969.1 flagellin [Lysinibacillus composti]RQW75430.1 flagellin [Lysinibacillus composti]